MKVDHREYNFKESIARIDYIAASKEKDLSELEHLPPRSSLTDGNVFNVKCTALFIEVREPADLTDIENKQKLKLYRAYISEVTAVLNGISNCAEINMTGNSISAYFNTPFQSDIDEVFTTAARITSLVDIINYKFKSFNLGTLTIGIGISYGKALITMVGPKGSVGEVVWSGEAIKETARLAGYANKESTDMQIMVSEIFYYNLSENNRKLLAPNPARNCYHGDVKNSYMNNWYRQNCQEQVPPQ